MNQKDGSPPDACGLSHIHPTAKRCERDICRHDRDHHGQTWKHRAVLRPPASFDSLWWSLCFCSIRFCSPPWITSSLGIATRTSMLYSSCSTETPNAECLRTMTEAQSSATNSHLACSELVKRAQFILHRDVREQRGRLWQAERSSYLCQGPLHFSPVSWVSFYISSLVWKLCLFCAFGSTLNWRKYTAALLPCALWWEVWTSATSPLGTASTWGEWYSRMLSTNMMLWTRLISALSLSRAIRASVLLETRHGTQTRNSATISLLPPRENKLLSHETFEIDNWELHTEGSAQFTSQAHLLLSCLTGRQLISLLLRDGGTQATHLSCFLVFRWCNIQVSDFIVVGPCFCPCRRRLLLHLQKAADTSKVPPVVSSESVKADVDPREFFPGKESTYWQCAACLQPLHSCSAG